MLYTLRPVIVVVAGAGKKDRNALRPNRPSDQDRIDSRILTRSNQFASTLIGSLLRAKCLLWVKRRPWLLQLTQASANHFEVGLVEISVDQGQYMTGFDRVRDGFFDERSRWSDLTELPLCVGEVAPRDRAGIRAEVEPGAYDPTRDRKCSAPRLNSIAAR
jgi:hypothetical protein